MVSEFEKIIGKKFVVRDGAKEDRRDTTTLDLDKEMESAKKDAGETAFDTDSDDDSEDLPF